MYFYCFFSFEYFDPFDHYAACWVTLNFEKLPSGKFSPEAEAVKEKIKDGFNSRPNVGKQEQDRDSEL